MYEMGKLMPCDKCQGAEWYDPMKYIYGDDWESYQLPDPLPSELEVKS